MTIAPSDPTLYVTRTAVLGYQELFGGGFEAIRRRLTVKMLGGARPDPDHDDCFLLDVGAMTLDEDGVILRVYTIMDGPLLVVPKVELAHPPP